MKLASWTAAAVLLGFTASRVEAVSSGIFDYARPGCTCHGMDNPFVKTTTQLKIDGLPDEGYVSGKKYTLTIWVLGAAIPLPLLVGLNLRGFNLEVTAGSLAPVDGSAQVASECQLMQTLTACNPATTCGVKIENPDTPCSNSLDCFQRHCSTPGTSACRLCSMVVSPQATHTSSNGFGPESFTDGNSVLMWQVQWTAPDPGVGDVDFYLAGNVVNGNREADTGDTWSVLAWPMVVKQVSQ